MREILKKAEKRTQFLLFRIRKRKLYAYTLWKSIFLHISLGEDEHLYKLENKEHNNCRLCSWYGYSMIQRALKSKLHNPYHVHLIQTLTKSDYYHLMEFIHWFLPNFPAPLFARINLPSHVLLHLIFAINICGSVKTSIFTRTSVSIFC